MMSFRRSMGSIALMLATAITLLTSGVQGQAIAPTYNTAAYQVAITTAPASTPMTGMNNVTNVAAADDRVDYVPLGFQFVFFNRTFNSVNVSSNGNLQFNSASTGTGASLFSSVTSEMAPVIAFFHTDLNPTVPTSRTWITSGTAPSRQWTLRINGVKYYGAGVNDTGLTADVILSEGTNTIDMRYYQVPTDTRTVEIGLQNSASGGAPIDWVSIWNDLSFNATTSALLQGKQVRYTPLNSVAPGTPPPSGTCAVTPVYNSPSYTLAVSTAPAMESVTGLANLTAADDDVNYIPIGFSFTFYNRSYTSINISSNGNAQFLTSMTGYSDSFFGTSAGSYAPGIAFFHTDLKSDQDNQRTYATVGTAGSRKLIVRFSDVFYCCSPTPGEGLIADLILTETTNTIQMRYYRVPVGTRNVEIGLQNSVAGDWVAYWNDREFDDVCATSLTGKQILYTPVNQGGSVTPPTTTGSSSTGAAAARSSSSSAAVVASSSSVAAARSSSSSIDAIRSSSSSAAAATPSSSTAIPVVRPSSSSAAIPVASSSVVPVVSSSALPIQPSSTAASGGSTGAIIVPDYSSTSSEQPPENVEDPGLNGSASINSILAFVVIAVSMVLAL